MSLGVTMTLLVLLLRSGSGWSPLIVAVFPPAQPETSMLGQPGVLAAIVPTPLVIILTVFVVVLLTTRYVSLASIAASFTLPFATWLTGLSGNLIGVTAAMAVLAIYKHKSNIQRLLNGTEHRLGRKKTDENTK